jgi:uncharacterized protein YcbX
MKYKVKQLFVYPVKSFGGQQVPQMEINETGPKYDRKWMVVDEKGAFLTQRQYPKMSQVTARIIDDAHVELTAPGVDFMDFGTDEFNAEEPLEVTVWKTKAKAYEVDPEVSQWVSDFLGVKCKLVRMDDDFVRPIDEDYGEGQINFSDGFPFLILSIQSLELLNQKLNKAFAIKRFRPNIVVQIDEPHQEDYWTQIQIGDVLLRGAKLCSRCKITTIDPMTGEFGDEPLVTLGQYRKTDQGIVFGKNFVHENQGSIRQGMDVDVLEYLDYQPVLEEEVVEEEVEVEEDYAEL